ncbi:MAG: DUF3450 family protein [Fibrobacteraceae bacterium]|nr:DUF3450 family protein [Fibrobacteraceae bacterium]
MKKILWLCLLVTVSALADTSDDIRAAQLEKERLNSEIAKLGKQISETEAMIREDDKRFKTLEERYRKDTERRKAEIDSLNAKIRNVASELQNERSKQAAAKNRSENIKAKRKALNQVLVAASKKLEQQIEQTLPWERESRLERVRSLSRDMESGNASVEEGFSRLKSLIGEETRFGDEVAIINAPITRKNGELINARILRIGNQWMVYSDENDTQYGALMRKTENGKISYEWKEDLDLAEREAVKFALDVKQARKPPQIVTLPVSLSIVAEEGK